MRIDGGCHCGTVSYEAEINPDNVVIGHCTDCQTISGAPYRVNVPVLVSKFQLNGTPRQYRKIGDSGEPVITNFCSECGAALFSHKGEQPRFVFLRIGSANQRADLAPRAQGFCRSAMPWAWDITGVPKIPSPPPSKPEQRPD